MMTATFTDHRQRALFLDVDGTLLDIAPTPTTVQVPAHLPALLARLAELMGGAVALISGRQLQEIDRLFAPYRFCGSGAHGCELRGCDAALTTAPVNRKLVALMHERCRALACGSPGILVECKQYGAAIHYRLAPHAEPIVAAYVLQLLADVGPDFQLQPGKYVYELKPAGFSKATAIRALMRSVPFASRQPVFIGDDATDEHGFATVNELDGISIKVGLENASIAQRRVAAPSDVRRLLAQLHDQLSPARTGEPDWIDAPFANRIL